MTTAFLIFAATFGTVSLFAGVLFIACCRVASEADRTIERDFDKRR
jgi:hypothetical protein